MPEIGTSGLMSGDGKQGDAGWPKPLRPSSTLPDRVTRNTGCTAPGFLDNRFHYAARLKVWSCQAARMASGLRWPFFSISHSAL
jgi:hypothetical protein